MIGEILSQHAWLWPLLWQSSVCLALGLGGSSIWSRQPTRAHRVLLLALLAAATVPLLSHAVKRQQWGLLTGEPTAVNIEQHPVTAEEVRVVSLPPAEGLAASIPSLAEAGGPPPATAPAQSDPTRLLALLWLVASVVLLIRLVVRWLLGYRLARRSRTVTDHHILTALDAAQARLHIPANVLVRSSANVRSPVIWCWSRKPLLLVPNEARPSDTVDWTSVMCHELAHWKRRDHLASLAVELLLCLLPWQVLLWVVRHRLTVLSEEACDDWVIASGLVTTRYAQTLLRLIPQGGAALAPAVVTSRKGLAGRVRRIVEHKCANPVGGRRWTLAAAGLAAILAAGIAFAQTRPAAAPGPALQDVAADVEADADADADSVVLHLVDPNGAPVAGALMGPGAHTVEEGLLGRKLSFLLANASDARGNATIELPINSGTGPQTLYLMYEESGLAAFQELGPADAGKSITIRMVPACHVQGRLDSAGLRDMGWPLFWTNVYLYRNGDRLLQHMSEKQQVEFWLPPGRYELHAYGTGQTTSAAASSFTADTITRPLTITVEEGQSELDLGVIDLPPNRLATLIGKPAPELTQIKDWKNSRPTTLAELRGRFVLLDFWGYWCGPCIRAMPELMELHDAFADKGLVIIGVHDDSVASIAEMDSLIEQARRDYWDGRDLPFLVALDGGGDTPIADTDATARGATTAAYGITSFPTTVLIGRQGEVIGSMNASGAEEVLSELLGVSPPVQEAPAWEQPFNEVYWLEEDEIIKRIAPPFIPERMDYYRTEHAGQAELIPGGPDYMTFHWDGTRRDWGMGFGRPTSLGQVLGTILSLKRFEYDGPEGLLDLELAGDWIVRDELPQEVKLRALEELIARELGREIRFEKRTVERQVITATGRFQFHPPTDTYESTSVHMYADEGDPDEGAGGGTADSLADFLRRVGDRVNMPVIDRTEPGEEMRIPYRHHRSSRVYREGDAQEQARKLRLLLDHLTEQTELGFEVTTQPVEVWFAIEDSAA